jgi:hypothetical protein
MRFIRYNPSNGDITFYGYMEDEFVEAEIVAGKPTLITDAVADFDTWKVDLETKQLVRVNPSVIEAIPQEILDSFQNTGGAMTP